MIVFILSMPNVGSWNGQWSGARNLYCRTRKLTKDLEKELDGKSFYYNFGDGWGASIKAKKVGAREGDKMEKQSRGFCGYEWMIDSILVHKEIIY